MKLEGSENWLNLIRDMGIKLNYVSRENLVGAHNLARQSCKRSTMLHAWC